MQADRVGARHTEAGGRVAHGPDRGGDVHPGVIGRADEQRDDRGVGGPGGLPRQRGLSRARLLVIQVGDARIDTGHLEPPGQGRDVAAVPGVR